MFLLFWFERLYSSFPAGGKTEIWNFRTESGIFRAESEEVRKMAESLQSLVGTKFMNFILLAEYIEDY